MGRGGRRRDRCRRINASRRTDDDADERRDARGGVVEQPLVVRLVPSRRRRITAKAPASTQSLPERARCYVVAPSPAAAHRAPPSGASPRYLTVCAGAWFTACVRLGPSSWWARRGRAASWSTPRSRARRRGGSRCEPPARAPRPRTPGGGRARSVARTGAAGLSGISVARQA